jgi:cardiolipin synthase A/B
LEVLNIKSVHQTFTRLLAATLSAAVLGGCAHVPSISEPPVSQGGAPLQVSGARGPLSQRETNALLKRLAAQAPDAGALERHLAIEQAIAGAPLYAGNEVTILRDGDSAFAATFAAIHGAKRYLYLEYYTLEEVQHGGEQLSDLLIARRRAGVQIDLMYDSIGSIATPAQFFERLGEAGINVQPFNPLNPLRAHFSLNDRDHRKLLVADGQLAVIGGVNLSSNYESGTLGSSPQSAEQAREPWHDTDLAITGPAVRALKQLFDQHWLQQGGAAPVLAADLDPGTPGDQVIHILGSQAGGALSPRYYATLLSAIRSAESSIDITAAYFAPTLQEQHALIRAARRGVSVRLLLPSHSDSFPALAVQHSHYAALLRGGVQIYERQDGILHSKTMVTDGVWSIVGSSNFDHRSVLFNDEIDAVVIGAQTGAQLQRFFDQDLLHAQRIDAHSWQQRPFSQRLHERFWRLWEQLL